MPDQSTKPRFPRAAAIAVAREIVTALEPGCTRLIVAGSLRRKKAEVGDVEILFIPAIEKAKVDLLRVAFISKADLIIERLLAAKIIAKRPSKFGQFSWGKENKLAIHSASGIPVDFFTATEANWYNYLVCRTGPADLNIRIASEAKKRGYRWNPYGVGFTHLESGMVIPTLSEEDVFQFTNIPFPPPWERI